jgi:hypothetical protein
MIDPITFFLTLGAVLAILAGTKTVLKMRGIPGYGTLFGWLHIIIGTGAVLLGTYGLVEGWGVVPPAMHALLALSGTGLVVTMIFLEWGPFRPAGAV